MIVSFAVENFGPIKTRQEISFEAQKSSHLEDDYVIVASNGMRLLKVAMVFGANAAGKTTIINSMRFLHGLVCEPLSQKNESLKYTPFLFDKDFIQKDSSMSIDFISNGARYNYEVCFNTRYIVSESLNIFSPRKTNVFRRTTDENAQTAEIKFNRSVRISKVAAETLRANTLWNTTVLSGYLKTNFEQSELSAAVKWFSGYFSYFIFPQKTLSSTVNKLIDSNLINSGDVVNILKKADFNVSNIKIKESENLLLSSLLNEKSFDVSLQHSVDGQEYELPMQEESRGTQRFYGLAGYLAASIRLPILLAIDELDSSLHPDLVWHFLLMFLKNVKSSQLLVTTHNRELLGDKNVFRDDAVWFVDKGKNGSTELYSLDDFDTSVVRDTTNVLNAYRSGKLKAIPNLSDYYL